MKKIIFKKFFIKTLNFFCSSLIIIGLIVWTLQAVNFFDFVTQDGHGLKVYFLYTALSFPKIIHRVLPFVFLISIFYMIVDYENKNQFIIFWINGISKRIFYGYLIIFSLILMFIQIILGSYVSPTTQFMGRNYLKESNIDFFTALLKEKKFINSVKGLTIFIDQKNKDGSYSNIFLEDSTKNISRTIYANKGILIEENKKKIFQLYKGRMITNENERINLFQFEKINFDLSTYASKTIITPKIQEINSLKLLNCFEMKKLNFLKDYNFECNDNLKKEALQELLKRVYKPIYIPVVCSICAFLLIFSNNNKNYTFMRNLIFIIGFLLIVISEASLRYSAESLSSLIIYIILPVMIFFLSTTFFYKKTKNV